MKRQVMPLFLSNVPSEVPMKKIKLTGVHSNLYAIVDDDLYDKLKIFKWLGWKHSNMGKIYAKTNLKLNGKFRFVTMHRLIMGLDSQFIVDHINHNGLDNRRCNLRLATVKENFLNSRKVKKTSSIYRGVTWDKQNMQWRAKIRCHGKCFFLGLFKDEDDAGLAYKHAAQELFGEFAPK